MRLCVGAVSRIVVEEAARLQVPQIVASRRQVDIGGGYTGYDQQALVDVVKELSDGATAVVRDHGGPYRNGDPDDDWLRSFDSDVAAGFDALHIDVCDLPQDDQIEALDSLCHRYANTVDIEVGGERDSQEWLDELLEVALRQCTPTYAITCVGGHAHADRQAGYRKSVTQVLDVTRQYHELGVQSKAHNMDWMGRRFDYADALDAYNVAPEFAQVEMDAWFRLMDADDVDMVLKYAYTLGASEWRRWFDEGEGTYYERARCGARYLMTMPVVTEIFDKYTGTDIESRVRNEVRDAIALG